MWQKNLDSETERYLNKILRKVKNEEEAYKGLNAATKQLWVAIAHLTKEVEELKNELNSIQGKNVSAGRRKREISQVLRKSLESY